MKVYHNCKRAQSAWEIVEENMDHFPVRFVMFTVGLLDTIDDRRYTTPEQDDEDAIWLGAIEDTFLYRPIHRAMRVEGMRDIAREFAYIKRDDHHPRVRMFNNIAKYIENTLDPSI